MYATGGISMVSSFELVLRLVLSAAIGGVIGIEREANNRPAGFRTHILVTLGAALIMLISIEGFNGMGSSDPSRLAAQVVSGIGFLGAGTIIRNGNNIKGLTTAASLWVCAGVGLAIGGGYYLGGLISALIVFISLTFLNGIEQKLKNKKYKRVTLQCRERAGLIGDLGQFFGKNNIMIKDIRINRNDIEYDSLLAITDNSEEYDTVELEFSLMLNKGFNYPDLNVMMSEVQGVEEIIWEN